MYNTPIRPADLTIDTRSLGDKKLLCEIVPVFEYKDGKRGNAIIAYKYIVALPALQLRRLAVRIEKDQPLFELTEDYTEVDFDNLTITMYEMNGITHLRCVATGIKAAKAKS